MSNYDLSLQDVDAYLASKQDGEIVGISQHGGKCLLAETLQWKYQTGRVVVGGGTATVEDYEWRLPEDLIFLYHRFDGCGMECEVTKREWLERNIS
jgi:hypothetical protein